MRAAISSLASVLLGAVLCLVLFANGTLTVDGDPDDTAADSTAAASRPTGQDRGEPTDAGGDDHETAASGSTATPSTDGGDAVPSSQVAQAGPAVAADDGENLHTGQTGDGLAGRPGDGSGIRRLPVPVLQTLYP